LERRHEAFGELVKRFQDMAFGCAYAVLEDPQLAEDTAQEAFITVYQQLGQLREPKAFPGWLRRVVLTQCSRVIRRGRIATQPIDITPHLPSNRPGPLAVIEGQQMRERVLTAIQTLPERQRMVTMLFYINGYSQREIADFLEVSVDAVKKRLQRARKRLRGRLVDMVRYDLQAKRPSRDDRFVQTVQVTTALESAALEGQLAMLELLLIDGMDVNATIQDGQTLLHWAAQRDHLDAAELLLRHGADVDIRDDLDKTPLQWALERGHREIVGLLLRHTG